MNIPEQHSGLSIDADQAAELNIFYRLPD